MGHGSKKNCLKTSRRHETMNELSREARDRLSEALHAATLTPSAEELTAAPEIDEWLAVRDFTGRPLLMGQVKGHPLLGDKNLQTSPVMKIDIEAGYARTQSRWYRLGRPMAETNPEDLAAIRALRQPYYKIVEGDELATSVQEECDRITAALMPLRPDA